MTLNQALTLPCGISIPNRLAKAAMTEGLADPGGLASERLIRLYRRWAEGGVGLQLTGNIMVDHRYRERPANVVIDGEQTDEAMAGLSAWAQATQSHGGKVIGQISHAGRQSPKSIAPEPVGPSAVAVKLPGGLFGKPRALSAEEIADIIQRFAHTARVLGQAGFDGVQIHAAHGYLISEFLNPLVNRRSDDWGGSLENRSRLLIEIVRAVRVAIGADRILSIKLNSSDFQKGGFSFEDCQGVVELLDAESVDLLEISGGNYEQPRMMGMNGLEPLFEDDVRDSTRAREAYFMQYAARVIESTGSPVMVTGGFRTRTAMDAALNEGVAMIGLGRPLCVDPDAPNRLLRGDVDALPAVEKNLRLGPGWLGPNSSNDLVKAANGFASMAFYYRNIIKIANGQPASKSMSPLIALVRHQFRETRDAKEFT